MEEEIIELYKCGKQVAKIAKIYSIPAQYIYNILERNGVKRRSNKINQRKYSLNETFFDDICSENKSYWLGFAYADGYITRNSFGVSLSLKDYSHLEKLKVDIEQDCEIKIYNGNGYQKNLKYCRALFTSEHLVNSMIQSGVLRNKSLILEPPKNIPDNFIKDFIRGYFDGDGCISTNGNSYYCSFMGTPSIISWISDVLINQIGVSRNPPHYKRHPKDTVVSIGYYGNDCYKVICYMYDNSNIYLDRKFERYILAKEYFSLRYQK